MGKSEVEQAAALIVYVCTVKGDAWAPMTWADLQAAIQTAVAAKEPTPRERWLLDIISNPFVRPDVHRLVERGFAEKLSAEGEPIVVQLLPKAFVEIEKRWVPRRPPVACSECKTPIAKFIEPGAEWHPCRDCDGALCEKCCDAKKARTA